MARWGEVMMSYCNFTQSEIMILFTTLLSFQDGMVWIDTSAKTFGVRRPINQKDLASHHEKATLPYGRILRVEWKMCYRIEVYVTFLSYSTGYASEE